MKKVNELWSYLKSSIRWGFVIFWLIVCNIFIIPIWTVGTFIVLNLLFFLMILLTWLNERQARKLCNEKVKTDELISLELPTFDSWDDVLELHYDYGSARQFIETMKKNYPNGFKIKNTK